MVDQSGSYNVVVPRWLRTLKKNSTLQKPCERPVKSCFQPCLRALEMLSAAPQATLTLSFMFSKLPAYSISQHNYAR